MTVKAGYSTPMLHVNAIEDSIRFYELLGFHTVDSDRTQPLGWARMHCEGGAIMFLRAEEPSRPEAHHAMLCMYTADLAGLREQLLQSGINPPAIKYPFYMPSGELSLRDPDGNIVLISHWGRAEQETWEKRIRGAKEPIT